MTDVLTFDLHLEAVPVQIAGERYVLSELRGLDRDKYLTNLSRRMKTSADGKTSTITSFDGLHSFLVSLALRKVLENGTADVPESTIQEWPGKVIKALFDKAKELSGLEDEDERPTEEKND